MVAGVAEEDAFFEAFAFLVAAFLAGFAFLTDFTFGAFTFGAFTFGVFAFANFFSAFGLEVFFGAAFAKFKTILVKICKKIR